MSTHVFELNLTSVCVSSGVIQLPFKMLEFFVPGRVAAELDGEQVELDFQAPRRLHGLRAHFGARGLRSNDVVRFSLEVEDGRLARLNATCVRRERQRPSDDGTAEQGRPAAALTPSPAGSWDSVQEVRAVKRVRIPGLPTAQSPAELDLEAQPQRSSSLGGGQPVSAGAEGWRADPVNAEDEQFTSVRVRKRSHVVDAPMAVAATAPSDGEPAKVAQVVGPSSEPAREVQLADLIAPPIGSPAGDVRTPEHGWRPRNWAALSSRMRFGARQPSSYPRAQPYTSGPTDQGVGPARNVESPQVADEGVEPELVAVGHDVARPANEVAAVPSQVPTGRTAGPRAESVAGTDVPGPVQVSAAPRSSARPRTQHGASSDYADSASRAAAGDERVRAVAPAVPDTYTARPGADERAVPVRSAAPVRESSTEPEGKATQASARSIPLIDDADFGGDYLFDAQESEEAPVSAAGGLEADMAMVAAYLARPDTPAIVRAEAVGEVLGIGEARAERALERVSERPDQVNRIRRGAYMVRARRS